MSSLTKRMLIGMGCVLCSLSASAAPPREPNMPPPVNIASLAEQLAPLIKQQPQLPAAHPVTPEEKPQSDPNPLLPIEQDFSNRAGRELRLFGYNQIGANLASDAPPMGQIQDDMVIGVGDRITVTFRGQRDDSKTYLVTPQGQLIVDGLQPVPAAGITFAELRRAIDAEAARRLMNTTAFVSVRELRQIAISVMGEVRTPGIYTLSAFHTVLDALAKAGGITGNGSLRNVRLLRGTETRPLDFYQLLLQGDMSRELQLRDGDKIMVPILGETVAIAGDVKRPGIFERKNSDMNFSLAEMMQLSGGLLRPGSNRMVKLSLTSWGGETTEELHKGDSVQFNDGSILLVTAGDPLRTNSFQVMGHVRQPGTRSLAGAKTLQQLFPNAATFKNGVYPLLGLLKRVNKVTLGTELIAFSPAAIVQKKHDFPLGADDEILIFSLNDMREILNTEATEITPPATASSFNRDASQVKNSESEEDDVEANSFPSKNPLLTPGIVQFLQDHAADIQGPLEHPGLYPVAEKVTLGDLLSVVGGIRATADTQHVEIILAHPKRNGKRYVVDLNTDKPQTMYIAARDKIRLNDIYTPADIQGVILAGEVMRPGRYDLRKGDTLLDILDRAGGLTETAFAPGTVFTRASERRKQTEQFRRVARELDLSVANFVMKKETREKQAEQIRIAQEISSELKRTEGVGRITVEADPAVLRSDPASAILLQSGDKIYVPRRPATVAVAGEILAPAALQYKPGLTPNDYLRQSGGLTRFADEDRIFVLFPDGSAAPVRDRAAWRNGEKVPVGATIIVPRDPDPLDFLTVTSSIGNILSQLAISAIGIADITDHKD